MVPWVFSISTTMAKLFAAGAYGEQEEALRASCAQFAGSLVLPLPALPVSDTAGARDAGVVQGKPGFPGSRPALHILC